MTRDKLNNLIGEAYSGWDKPYRPLIRLFGEAIFQLTRIADQANQRGRIGELERLLAHASKERKRRIEEIDKLRAAPDALVEAVKLIASMECGIHHHTDGKEIPCGVCVRMKEIADKAAHVQSDGRMTEKAGG